MKTFTVRAWNQYSTPENLKHLIVKADYEAGSLTDAISLAEKSAAEWNKDMHETRRVNFITCNGYVRTC